METFKTNTAVIDIDIDTADAPKLTPTSIINEDDNEDDHDV